MIKFPPCFIKFSIIIPELNDERALLKLLANIKPLVTNQETSCEVIVVSGSENESVVKVCNKLQIKYFLSPPGRAKQQNMGAQNAEGKFLLFLHADSSFSDLNQLVVSLEQFFEMQERNTEKIMGGHFKINFLLDNLNNKKGFFYRFLELKTSLDRVEVINGDQGILVKRKNFIKLGGFDEQFGFLEDKSFAKKLKREGEWNGLSCSINSSARRFESEGLLQRAILNIIIMYCYDNYHHFDNYSFNSFKNIYVEQSKTNLLLLCPFFSKLFKRFLNLEFENKIKIILRLGEYTKDQAWQVALFLDALFQRRNLFFYKFCNRIAEPALDNIIGVIFSSAVFCSLFCSLWSTFFIIEKLNLPRYKEKIGKP